MGRTIAIYNELRAMPAQIRCLVYAYVARNGQLSELCINVSQYAPYPEVVEWICADPGITIHEGNQIFLFACRRLHFESARQVVALFGGKPFKEAALALLYDSMVGHKINLERGRWLMANMEFGKESICKYGIFRSVCMGNLGSAECLADELGLDEDDIHAAQRYRRPECPLAAARLTGNRRIVSWLLDRFGVRGCVSACGPLGGQAAHDWYWRSEWAMSVAEAHHENTI